MNMNKTFEELANETEKVKAAKQTKVPLNSNAEYQKLVAKHTIAQNCQEKQRQPLLASQEVGWDKEKYDLSGPLKTAILPSCDITRFAAELVKSGVF